LDNKTLSEEDIGRGSSKAPPSVLMVSTGTRGDIYPKRMGFLERLFN